MYTESSQPAHRAHCGYWVWLAMDFDKKQQCALFCTSISLQIICSVSKIIILKEADWVYIILLYIQV